MKRIHFLRLPKIKINPQIFYFTIPGCEVEGTRIAEGERVLSAEANCTQCFCLRGSVRCQRLACGPPLLGCTPLLRNGECCPHQYHCAQGIVSASPYSMLSNSIYYFFTKIIKQNKTFRFPVGTFTYSVRKFPDFDEIRRSCYSCS